jgi:hypothetical protein
VKEQQQIGTGRSLHKKLMTLEKKITRKIYGPTRNTEVLLNLFRGIYIHNNVIRIWVSLVLKLVDPLTGGLPPQIPVLSNLYPQLNLLNPLPEKISWCKPPKIAGYATGPHKNS